MIRESPEIRRDRDTEKGGRKDKKVQHKKSNTQIIGALKTWNRKTGEEEIINRIISESFLQSKNLNFQIKRTQCIFSPMDKKRPT